MTLDCEQGTAFWHELRRGLVTASRCADVISTVRKKGEEAAARRNYRSELIVEILTGLTTESYVTREMQWGRGAGTLRARRLRNGAGRHGRDLRLRHPSRDSALRSLTRRLGRRGWDDSDQVPEYLYAFSLDALGVHSGRARGTDAGGAGVHRAAVERLRELRFEASEALQLYIRRFERNQALVTKLEAKVVQFNADLDAMLAELPQSSSSEGQPIVGLLDHTPDDEVEL